MVTAPATPESTIRRRAFDVAAAIVDPEMPVLTIAELGILRDVTVREGRIEIFITPTYLGCPAISTIALDIEVALEKAGFEQPSIKIILSPAWTTDWISQAAREKLRASGIAPPGRCNDRRPLFSAYEVACPKCSSRDTERLAEFASTSCKALWRCMTCREPFDHLKCH